MLHRARQPPGAGGKERDREPGTRDGGGEGILSHYPRWEAPEASSRERSGGSDHLAPFEVSLAVVSFCKVREWEQEHGVRSGDPIPRSLQPRVGAVPPGCRPSHSRLVICPSKR